MRSQSRHQVSFSGLAGTPLYMSPEQLEHTRCTAKVDIYALGIIYFEMNYVFETAHERQRVSISASLLQCVTTLNSLKVLTKLQKDFNIPSKYAERFPEEV